MLTHTRRLFGLLLIFGSCAAAHAEIYKWKDAQGETHYSNTMPPQAAGLANTELNKRGLVIKEQQAAPTLQQRLNNEAEQARLATEREALTEQKRHDTALLNTYTTPAEIDLARERNLVQTRLVITGTNARLTPLREAQTRLIKQAGGKIPDKGALAAEYQNNEKHIALLNDIIAQKYKEMEQTRSKFDADKARFITLTAKNPGSMDAMQGNLPGGKPNAQFPPPVTGKP